MEEATSLLAGELSRYRELGYAALVALIAPGTKRFGPFEFRRATPAQRSVIAPSGDKYHLLTEVFWDDVVGGDVRVVCIVDGPGRPRLIPLQDDLIMRADGTIID